MKYFIYCTRYGKGTYGRVEEFDGNLADAGKFFANKEFYGGDWKGKPEDYIKNLVPPNLFFVIPRDDIKEFCFDEIVSLHKKYHKEKEAKELEQTEKAEYERLKAKYERLE